MAANPNDTIQEASALFVRQVSAKRDAWNAKGLEGQGALADAYWDTRVAPQLGPVGQGMQTLGKSQFRESVLNPQSFEQIRLNDEITRQNPFQTFGNEFVNQLSLDTVDLPANYQNPQNMAGGFGGRLAGGLAQDFGAGLAGAGIGGAVAGPVGAAAGYGIGQFGSGFAQGFSGAIDRFQDEGRQLGPLEYLAATGEGAGFGALNIVPVVGQADNVLKAAAKNAALQGAGTAGIDATSQLITDGQVDLNRALTAGAVGAGGGIAGTALPRMAGNAGQAARRFNQGFAALQRAIGITQPSAPVGLGQLNRLDGLPDLTAPPVDFTQPPPVDTATAAVSGVIPEGQGAGTAAAASPAESMDAVIDQLIDFRKDKQLKDFLTLAEAQNEGGIYNEQIAKIENYLFGSDEEVLSLGQELARRRAAEEPNADDLLRNVPTGKASRVRKEAARQKRIARTGEAREDLERNELEAIADRMRRMQNEGKGEEAKLELSDLNQREKAIVKDSLKALRQREKDAKRVQDAQIKEEARQKYAKQRSEAEKAKLQERLAKEKQKIESRRFDRSYSKPFDELDALAGELADLKSADGSRIAKIKFTETIESEGLSKLDVAYIDREASKMVKKRATVEADRLRAANQAVKEELAASKEVQAIVKGQADSIMGAVTKISDGVDASELLNELGYTVKKVADRHGKAEAERSVFFGGKTGTVKFEPGATVSEIADQIAQKGGNLSQILGARLYRQAQDAGVSPFSIMEGRIKVAEEAAGQGRGAGVDEGLIDLDEAMQSAADAELRQQEAQYDRYIEDMETSIAEIEKRLDAAKTPEEAVEAFDYFDNESTKYGQAEQEYIFNATENKVTRVIDLMGQQLDRDATIDKAIKERLLVNLDDVAFEHIGATETYEVNGQVFASGKKLTERPRETILAKDVNVIQGTPYPYIKTIDENGQYRFRYLDESPKGSKVGKITLTDEVSPYSVQEIDGKKMIVGENGEIIEPLSVAEERLTSQQMELNESLEFFAEKIKTVADAVKNNQVQATDAVDLIRAARHLGFENKVNNVLRSLDPEARAKLHKDVTGADC